MRTVKSFLIFVAIVVSLYACSTELSAATPPLTSEQRIQYQRAIEKLRWRHRIWPKENSTPKPRLESILPDGFLQSKVDDYLEKSNALEIYWQHPIQPEQLQAEMDRMARNTKQPEVLRELFAALGNDPLVIAECLARPILADRLIHNMYAGDERIHGALKQQVESELSITNTVEAMRALSGTYSESVWNRKETGREELQLSKDGSIPLDSTEWENWTALLRRNFGSPERGSDLPLLKVSRLREDNDRFYVIAVLEKEENRIKLATVEWKKRSFEDWWREFGNQFSTDVIQSGFIYTLPSLTTSASDTWAPTPTGVPSPRESHTAIWTGSEMIIWGGFEFDTFEFFNTGGRYDPATDTWDDSDMSLIEAPTIRSEHTAVWTGTEMIVWGGIENGFSRVNSGGRYNPVTNTWLSTSTTNAPTPREGHSAVWTGSKMVIWGGSDNSSLTNTGGRYDPATNTWTSTSLTSAPVVRQVHTAIWTGSQMVVWGGGGASGSLNSGGRYNPNTDIWLATTATNAPTARAGHTAIWTGTEMIVWGGGNTASDFNTGGRYNPATDTWVVGGTTTTNAPSARGSHKVVWTGSRMIVWGGEDFSFNFLNSGGIYDPAANTWTAGGTSIINAPTIRVGATAVWTGSEMIIWGGFEGIVNAVTNTGGRYDPATNLWTSGGTSLVSAPIAREQFTAVWTGNEMIIWGGITDIGSPQNTGGLYNPVTDVWAANGTSIINAPATRYQHTAVWTGNEMIVWGGFNGSTVINTGGRYNPATDIWTVGGTTSTNAPTAREAHSVVWTGSEMIVWGGDDLINVVNTGGRYNPSTNSWAAGGTNLTNAPSAREVHTAIWTGSEMIVWGGFDFSSNRFNTGGRYNPATNSWTAGGTSLTGAPAARFLHTAIWTGSEMIVWGGVGTGVLLNTGGRYNPATDAWTAGGTSTTGAPTIRDVHTAVWTGNRMIVWGGAGSGSDILNTGGLYDPGTDTWKAGGTSLINAPAIRAGQTVVWTGSKMIVWGGFDHTSNLNTGGIYNPNTAPVAEDQSFTINEDAPLGMTLSANDVDDDALVFSIVASPTHGTLSGSAPNSTYTPAANYNGPDSFTFRANDGVANSNIATVSITVIPVNDPPIANDQSKNTNEDTAVSVTLTANDVDGNPLSFSIVSAPLHGVLSGTATNLTYTPSANYNGPDSFLYKANDGTADSNNATVSITVAPVNDPPVANNQSVNATQNAPVAVVLTASDTEGSLLTFLLASLPVHGALSGTPPNLTYTPNTGFTGADNFTFKANDGAADSNIGTVSIAVGAGGHNPVASDDIASTPQDTAIPIDVIANDSDADADPLAVVSVAQGSNGSVSNNGDGTVTYTPDTGFSGPDNFAYTISDGNGGFATASVHITVIPDCLFCEEFNGTSPPANWTFTNSFLESGGGMTPVAKKKSTAVAAPAFTGCQACTIVSSIRSSVNSSSITIIGWSVNSDTRMELQMNHKVVMLKQRVNKKIVKNLKVKTPAVTINTSHVVTMSYDGTNVNVNIDGADVIPVFAPVGSLSSGTVGIIFKGDLGNAVDFFHVN